MTSGRIGVILPAYNEAPVIVEVLRSIPAAIVVGKNTYQLVPIVVDDGSQDGTAAVARTQARAVVISHLINSGAGAATRTGLHYLREHNFAYGATMDADGQHTPGDLRKVLLAAISGQADIIVGSRLANTAGMPWYKVIGNKGLNVFTRVLLGVHSSDSQSGLKAFSQKAIRSLSYRENGYAFCSEMLWRARKAGLSIGEVPIVAVYTTYSKGKGQTNWNGFTIIKQLIKHRLASLLHE